MLERLSNWKGLISIDGVKYESVSDASKVDFNNLPENFHIILYSKRKVTPVSGKEMRITVRQYMTKKSTPEFDFMLKWNNDKPMPLRTMIGTVEKETPGMVYMKLHGDIYADRIFTCMKCGRQITNPVSQFFGMGPECGGHNYVNPFDSEAELKSAVASYRKELQNIKWEGWIIKSAIVEKEEL